MRSLLLLLGAFAASVAGGCWLSPRTPEEFVAHYGGNVASYRAIARMTNCLDLSDEITASQNNYEDSGDRAEKGYFEAAWLRYEEVGCDHADNVEGD